MPRKSTVFLVDDDEGLRDALGTSLELAGFQVQAYDSGEAFLEAYNPDQPGCLLMDLCMPEMNGLEVQQELIRREIRIPIIMMTAHGTIPDTVTAIKAGAVDFLEKPFPRSDLLRLIRESLALDRRIRGCEDPKSGGKASHNETRSHYERLSPREKEIMALIASGKTSKQVAKQLGISPRTVDAHRAHLMMKMQSSSLAELGALFTRCVDSLKASNELYEKSATASRISSSNLPGALYSGVMLIE